VEPEGIEPSSKRKTNRLSTRLSSFSFSTRGKTEAIYPELISLNFGREPEPFPAYFRYCCTTWSGRFGTTAPG
jgi:hypothetical protein